MQIKKILLESIVDDLVEKSFSLQNKKAPFEICTNLLNQVKNNNLDFNSAAVGRNNLQIQDKTIRSDKIKWITGQSQPEIDLLNWFEELKKYLNRNLYLGLNNIECHFSIYEPGDFYQKHVDAFRGKSNRKVSIVLYLNDNWQPEHQGELVIYPENKPALKIEPTFASFVVFMSEDIPHEVLKSNQNRYAIACWFRID
ncbi:MAG: 2OG-Fe(II) oxygenase [Saccharospirillaceae bacterium]|nr:2OG-Fe(II) oxygenase [Pseudomonadales bacterium]NRB80940.1 2OG-Fe(II) oxygenase [Saccharospirillaceae bacterium]